METPANKKSEQSPKFQVEVFKNRFGLKKDFVLPEDTQRALEAISSENPAIRPLTDNTVSEADKVNWKSQFVNLFSDGGKPTAHRIADRLLKNLERIGQDVFEQELATSFSWAKAELAPDKIKRAGFIYYNVGGYRSNEWVRSILKDHVDHPALKLPTVDYYDKDLIAQYDTGLVIDDASYSGQLVTDHIRNGVERFGMKNFLIVVPFMTDVAKLAAYNMAKERGVALKIYSSYTMATAEEILGKDDFDFLKRTFVRSAITNEHVTTFFAHKVSDDRSFLPFFGNTRHAQIENHLKVLVPQFTAVYKKDYFQDLKKAGFKGFKS